MEASTEATSASVYAWLQVLPVLAKSALLYDLGLDGARLPSTAEQLATAIGVPIEDAQMLHILVGLPADPPPPFHVFVAPAFPSISALGPYAACRLRALVARLRLPSHFSHAVSYAVMQGQLAEHEGPLPHYAWEGNESELSVGSEQAHSQPAVSNTVGTDGWMRHAQSQRRLTEFCIERGGAAFSSVVYRGSDASSSYSSSSSDSDRSLSSGSERRHANRRAAAAASGVAAAASGVAAAASGVAVRLRMVSSLVGAGLPPATEAADSIAPAPTVTCLACAEAASAAWQQWQCIAAPLVDVSDSKFNCWDSGCLGADEVTNWSFLQGRLRYHSLLVRVLFGVWPIEWMTPNDVPVNDLPYHWMEARRAVGLAAIGGHLRLLRALAVTEPCRLHSGAIASALAGGHMHIVDWIRDCIRAQSGGMAVKYDDRWLVAAAVAGSVQILDWVTEQRGRIQLRTEGGAGEAISRDHSDDDSAGSESDAGTSSRDTPGSPSRALLDAQTSAACAAAAHGRIDALEWLVARGVRLGKDIILAAAEGGHVRVLDMMLAARSPMPAWDDEDLVAGCWKRAGSGGRVSVMEWLVSHGCALSAASLALPLAAESGHVAVFDALSVPPHRPAAEWDADLVAECWRQAAMHSRLPVLHWLVARECGLKTSAPYAAATGAACKRHVLELLSSPPLKPVTEWDVTVLSSIWESASKNGHLPVLEWLTARGCIAPPPTILAALQRNREAVMEFLMAPPHELARAWAGDADFARRCWRAAIRAASVAPLRWLEAHGCPLASATDISGTGNEQQLAVSTAAARGDVLQLEWLHEHGWVLTTAACTSAAFNDQLEALQWLRAHDCPWDRARCLRDTGRLDIEEWIRSQPNEDISRMIAPLKSLDELVQLEAVAYFRKLSQGDSAPLDSIVELGIVPEFVRLLGSRSEGTQVEAARVLTNLAAGTSANTQAVVAAGAVPPLVALLQSPDAVVRDHAVCALSNIAGDSPDCRDLVLQSGALGGILRHAARVDATLTCRRSAAWAICNCLRGTPPPPVEVRLIAIPTLASLVMRSDHRDAERVFRDDEVLRDALWGLVYTFGEEDDAVSLQCFAETGAYRTVVQQLLRQSMTDVATGALRIVGSVFSGDELQTQAMLSAGAASGLCYLLEHSKDDGVLKEACWAVSNVTAGSSAQIQVAFDAGLVPHLVRLTSGTHVPPDTRSNACWAISNATTNASPPQIEFLVRCGVVGALASLIAAVSANTAVVARVALEGLNNLMRAGAGMAVLDDDAALHTTAKGAMLRLFARSRVPDSLLAFRNTQPDLDLNREAIEFMTTWFQCWSPSDTPLHYALLEDPTLALVEPIIAAHPRAAEEVSGVGNRTALHLALLRKVHRDVVAAVLVAYSAAAAIKDDGGRMPLHYAAWNSRESFTSVLAAYPAAAMELDSCGRTPLHWAACSNVSPENAADLLAAHSAAASKLDGDGCTPLHLAARSNVGLPLVVVLLQAHPAALALEDNDGFTPLHLAVKNASPAEVVSALFAEYPAAACGIPPSLRGSLPPTAAMAETLHSRAFVRHLPALLAWATHRRMP